MATATATVSVAAYPNGVDNTQRHAVLFGTIAVQASPAAYATGGLAVTFPTLNTNASSATPVWVQIKSASIDNIYIYAAGKVRIFVDGVELVNAAAIPAGISGDTITFRAEFNRGV